MIRKAQIQEVPEIRRLLMEFTQRWRCPAPDHGRPLQPGAGLFCLSRMMMAPSSAWPPCILWDDLGEIRSVAVTPEFQTSGIGSHLVEKCLEEARSFGLQSIFVLTSPLVPDFFKRFGFQVSQEELLPHRLGRMRRLRQVPRLRRNPHAPGAGNLEITITDYLAFFTPWRELYFSGQDAKAQRLNYLTYDPTYPQKNLRQ